MSYDYSCKVAIDGMDVTSVLSILTTNNPFREDRSMTIGVNFFLKTLRLFDPLRNKDIIVKVQVWIMTNEERFSFLVPKYYTASNVAFFIKENNNRSVEDFQAIVRINGIPIIKILDTPKEFTYELLESVIKEVILYFENNE